MTGSVSIITASYSNDLRVCELLCESIDRYVPVDIPHYLIIPRADLQFFADLKGSRRHLLFQEDVAPKWLKSSQFLRNWSFSWTTPPVRGWIRQQLVKLAIDSFVPAETLVIIDSDCFITRPWDPKSLVRADGLVPLYRELDLVDIGATQDNAKWHRHADSVLATSTVSDPRVYFVGQVMIWRKDILRQLHARLEEGTLFRSWQKRLCFYTTLSEYTLYGVFIEHVIGEKNSGHYFDPTVRTLDYWGTAPMTEAQLVAMKARLTDQHIGAMISAKSNTSAELIRKVFF